MHTSLQTLINKWRLMLQNKAILMPFVNIPWKVSFVSTTVWTISYQHSKLINVCTSEVDVAVLCTQVWSNSCPDTAQAYHYLPWILKTSFPWVHADRFIWDSVLDVVQPQLNEVFEQLAWKNILAGKLKLMGINTMASGAMGFCFHLPFSFFFLLKLTETLLSLLYYLCTNEMCLFVCLLACFVYFHS